MTDTQPQKRRSPAHPISRAVGVERSRKAIELRIQGFNLDHIANECGYTNRSGAFRAIERGLKQSLREPSERLRDLQNERLNRQIQSLWPSAMGSSATPNTNPPGKPSNATEAVAPDHRSHLRILQIMDRQAKLNGLDAPFEFTTVTTHLYESQLDKIFDPDKIPEPADDEDDDGNE